MPSVSAEIQYSQSSSCSSPTIAHLLELFDAVNDVALGILLW